jgi:FAD synthetase
MEVSLSFHSKVRLIVQAADLTYFDQTDANWPQLMRVHPIINWSYSDIWEFLRCPDLEIGKGVPYCQLYDYG